MKVTSTLKATLSSRSGTGDPTPGKEGMSQRGQKDTWLL